MTCRSKAESPEPKPPRVGRPTIREGTYDESPPRTIRTDGYTVPGEVIRLEDRPVIRRPLPPDPYLDARRPSQVPQKPEEGSPNAGTHQCAERTD